MHGSRRRCWPGASREWRRTSRQARQPRDRPRTSMSSAMPAAGCRGPTRRDSTRRPSTRGQIARQCSQNASSSRRPPAGRLCSLALRRSRGLRAWRHAGRLLECRTLPHLFQRAPCLVRAGRHGPVQRDGPCCETLAAGMLALGGPHSGGCCLSAKDRRVARNSEQGVRSHVEKPQVQHGTPGVPCKELGNRSSILSFSEGWYRHALP